jgi:hypothetical protein
MFTLGVLALSAYATGGLDVIDALLAVPFGLLAVLVLVAVEVDEAFANIYSTAVSTQNLSARIDRRVMALVIGTVATALALSLDVVAYEPFLFLLGASSCRSPASCSSPTTCSPRRLGRLGRRAGPTALLLPWAVGFVAYQLTVPTSFTGSAAGWTSWWAARSADLGVPSGLSASLVSLTVASLLTVAVALPGALRTRRAVA